MENGKTREKEKIYGKCEFEGYYCKNETGKFNT